MIVIDMMVKGDKDDKVMMKKVFLPFNSHFAIVLSRGHFTLSSQQTSF